MPRSLGEVSKPKDLTPWEKLVHESEVPTIYYFWSGSCSFCKKATPYIEQLESKYSKQNLEVVIIEVETNQDLVSSAGVDSWPTFFFVHNKKVIGNQVGWEKSSREFFEDRIGLIEEFHLEAGLEEIPDEDEGDQGCGGTASQIAELSLGIQESLDQISDRLSRIESELKRIR